MTTLPEEYFLVSAYLGDVATPVINKQEWRVNRNKNLREQRKKSQRCLNVPKRAQPEQQTLKGSCSSWTSEVNNIKANEESCITLPNQKVLTPYRYRMCAAAQRAQRYITPSIRKLKLVTDRGQPRTLFYENKTGYHILSGCCPPEPPGSLPSYSRMSQLSSELPSLPDSPADQQRFILSNYNYNEVNSSENENPDTTIIPEDEDVLQQVIQSAAKSLDPESHQDMMDALVNVFSDPVQVVADGLPSFRAVFPKKGSLEEWLMIKDMCIRNNEEITQELLDPVTGQIFNEPVVVGKKSGAIFDRDSVTEAEDLLVAGFQPDDTDGFPAHWINTSQGSLLMKLIRMSWMVHGYCNSTLDAATYTAVVDWIEPKRQQLKKVIIEDAARQQELCGIASMVAELLVGAVETVLDDHQRGWVITMMQKSRKWHDVACKLEKANALLNHCNNVVRAISEYDNQQMQLSRRIVNLEQLGNTTGHNPALLPDLKKRWYKLSSEVKYFRSSILRQQSSFEQARQDLRLTWNEGKGITRRDPLSIPIIFLPRPKAALVNACLQASLLQVRACPVIGVPWKKRDREKRSARIKNTIDACIAFTTKKPSAWKKLY